MKFKQIVENSLFTNNIEKAALIADDHKLMDAFYINFIGFIGLFSIKKLAPLKTYEKEEGKLQVNSITDTNKDVSVIIKLLFDNHIFTSSAVNKMTRLLYKIRSKSIKPEDIQDQIIRDLLIEAKYTQHKGTPLVMSIINNFVGGSANLQKTAFDLYQLSKKKIYKDISSEFRNIGIYYSALFRKLDFKSNDDSVQTDNKNTIKNIDMSPASSANIKLGETPEFWNKIYNSKNEIEFKGILETYGVKEDEVYSSFVKLTNGVIKAIEFGPIELKDIFNRYFINNLPIDLNKEKIIMHIYREHILKYVHTVQDLYNLYDIAINNNRFTKDFFRRIYSVNLDFSDKFKDVLKRLNGFFDEIIHQIKPNESHSEKEIERFYFLFRDFLFENVQNKIDKNPINFNDNVVILSSYTPKTFTPEYESLKQNIIFELKQIYNLKINNSAVIKSQLDNLTSIKNMLEKYNTLKILNIDIVEFNFFDEVQKINNYNDYINFLSNAKLTDNFIILHGFELSDIQKDEALFNVTSKLILTLEKNNDANEILNIYSRAFYANTNKILNLVLTYSKRIVKDIIDKQISFIQGLSDINELFVQITPINSTNIKRTFFETTFTNEFKDSFIKIQDDIDESLILLLSDKSFGFMFKEIAIQFSSNLIIQKIINLNIETDSNILIKILLNSQSFTGQIINKETTFKFFKKYIFDAFVNRDSLNVMIQLVDMINDSLTDQAKIEFTRNLSSFINTETSEMIKNTNRVSSFSILLAALMKNRSDLDINDDILDMAFNNKDGFYELSKRINKKHDNFKISNIFRKIFFNELNNDKTDFLLASSLINLIENNVDNVNLLIDDINNDELNKFASLIPEFLNSRDVSKYDFKNHRIINKEIYGYRLNIASILLGKIGSDVFSTPDGKKTVEKLAEILKKKTNIEKEYRESVFTNISNLFSNADITPDTEEAFATFEKSTRKILAANFALTQFAGYAVPEINEHATIKPRKVIKFKDSLRVMKLNQVNLPSGSIIDYRKGDHTLEDIKNIVKATALQFKLEEQAIEEVPMSIDEQEKLSIVLNSYNKYKHGGIAVLVKKVFNVNIPQQSIGWEEFLKEFAEKDTNVIDPNVDPRIDNNQKYYHKFPQFHGTASLPASMILRYGFTVIDEKLAREAGIKYAGRMLGDGIYSSNVIDKVAQYINDDAPTGVSRRQGCIGYLFEMETQGSHWGKILYENSSNDFSSGGTGEFSNERSGLVSPEWAWRYPNKQCKIKRCFEVEIINKDVMNELIKKHKDVVTEGIKYKFFRQFVNEISAPKEKNMRYVNFTFMDNIVPLTNRKYYDLEEKPEQNLKKLLPKDARIDHGQYGVIISFPYKEDINIRLLYGTDIETDSKVRNLYQSFFK